MIVIKHFGHFKDEEQCNGDISLRITFTVCILGGIIEKTNAKGYQATPICSEKLMNFILFSCNKCFFGVYS